MAPSPQPAQEPNLFGKFASVVGLLGTALFFTGWIYRWSYFSFFQLEITTLDLPPQSFLIVPLQVFLADAWTIAKTAIAFLLTGLAIYLSLWLIDTSSKALVKLVNQWTWQLIHYNKKTKLRWLNHTLHSLAKFNINKFSSIHFVRSLIDELIVVSWVLLILFWLANHQGITDARRDAGEKSTLPVVTLITPENRLALGRKLADVFTRPSLKGYKIIGDKGLFTDLRETEQTDTTLTENPIIWRLLLERGGWIYLFKALPANAKPDSRPAVIAIQESQLGEQLMILSPEPSKPRSP